MKKDIDDLTAEHEESEVSMGHTRSPIKLTIQQLFSNEFHGNEYKKFVLEDAKNLAIAKINEALIKSSGIYISSGKNLLNSIRKTKSVEALLLLLNEYLFN